MNAFLNLVQAVGSLLCLLSVAAMLGAGTLMVIDELRHRRNHKSQKIATKSKDALRREKEQAAHEDFFEETYVHGFDPSGALRTQIVLTPTDEALKYYKQMDELADAEIFNQTEDL